MRQNAVREQALKYLSYVGKLAERISRRPEWQTQTRAQRIAAVTAFITNYPAIKAARGQAHLDAALEADRTAYPELLSPGSVTRVLKAEPGEIPALNQSGVPVRLVRAIQPSSIADFPGAEAPDRFTVNRLFNWAKPHGQWMNQMLKDIDAAKAAADTEVYEALTARYSAWSDQYLLR